MIVRMTGKSMKNREKTIPILILFCALIITAGVVLFNPVPAHTLPSGEIEGIWQGILRFSGTELRVVFTITENPDNTLDAAMDVPEQNATGVPVDDVAVDDGNVRLEITSIEGVFEGKLAEDATTIDGTWTQGGMTLALVLERTIEKLILDRPQEPKEPFPYRVEEVVFKNTDAGIILAGTLTFPPSGGPFPAVLLLSGSGPQNRDEAVFGHRPFLVLADDLTRKGIAVLRVDDRGVGGSTGNFDEATAMDFAVDAVSGVTYLKNRGEINEELIGLIGHSEGGMIASMVASQSSDIAFMVLIASPGLPIEEMEYSDQARKLRDRGASADLIARNRALQENLFALIRRETDSHVVCEEITSIITGFFKRLNEEEKKVIGISEKNLEAHVHDQFQRLHSPWFRFYLPYDPGTVLQKVACPVLAINGEKDVQVPSQENLLAIENALEAGGNKDYIVEELSNLNHLLQTAETGSVSEYGKIEETLSPTALHIISDWILERKVTR